MKQTQTGKEENNMTTKLTQAHRKMLTQTAGGRAVLLSMTPEFKAKRSRWLEAYRKNPSITMMEVA